MGPTSQGLRPIMTARALAATTSASENMKDTDRVIMVKSDGRFGRIVMTAIRSRRSQEATSPHEEY
jgi:hypothetical protein